MNIIKNIVPKMTRIGFLAFALLTHSGMANSTARDEVVFFLPDALGSAITAVDESGGLCWEETYTPFGDKSVGGDTLPSVGCGLLGEERGFTGHTEDYESDLVYAQQRYYDPSIGRFLSTDPIDIDPLDTKTFNRYAYAINSPFRYTDPTGEYASDGIDSVTGSFRDLEIETGVRDGFGTLAPGYSENDSDSALGRHITSTFTSIRMNHPELETIFMPVPSSIGALSRFKDLFSRLIGRSKKPALPESYWINKRAPTQIAPGPRTIRNQNKPSSNGGTYDSTSHYDQFGRLIGQTHRTTHGRPNVHPNPHHHRRDPIDFRNLKTPAGSRTWPGLFGN